MKYRLQGLENPLNDVAEVVVNATFLFVYQDSEGWICETDGDLDASFIAAIIEEPVSEPAPDMPPEPTV